MAAKAQEETNPKTEPERGLAVKSGQITELTEWATSEVNSVEEMVALFGEQGVSYSAGEELTGDFQLVTGDKKLLFCKQAAGKPAFVVKWRFNDGSNDREYVTMHLVIDGLGKFILNDGAITGMYGQLRKLTDSRKANGITPDNGGLLVSSGIVMNKPYDYDTRTGKAIKRGEDVPAEFRERARDTFRFDL